MDRFSADEQPIHAAAKWWLSRVVAQIDARPEPSDVRQRGTNAQSRPKGPTNILTFHSVERERLPQLEIGEFRRKGVSAEVSELPIVHAAFSKTERGRLSSSPARTKGKLSTANRYFEHVSVKGPSIRLRAEEIRVTPVGIENWDRLTRTPESGSAPRL
jgi:hypothetical protein